MSEQKKQTKIPQNLRITMIGVFAALTIILSIAPLPSIGYVNIVTVMETIGAVAGSTGMLGGLGVAVGALIYNLYQPSELFLYGGFLPLASGAISIALMMHRKVAITLFFTATLLLMFFLAPGNAYVPVWALWDKFLALLLIYPTIYLVKKSFTDKGFDKHLKQPSLRLMLPLFVAGLLVVLPLVKSLELDNKLLAFLPQIPLIYAFTILALYLAIMLYLLRGPFLTVLLLSFIGLEIDCMVGNLLFGIYGYTLFDMTPSQVGALYIPFAIVAGAERLIVALISAYITLPLLVAINSNPRLKWLIYKD